MPTARRYLITGRVQGVGCRFFVHDAAVREGINGWVRNLPTGHVEVSAEGEPEAVARFERQLRQGPPAARVDRVDTVEESHPLHHSGFSIR